VIWRYEDEDEEDNVLVIEEEDEEEEEEVEGRIPLADVEVCNLELLGLCEYPNPSRLLLLILSERDPAVERFDLSTFLQGAFIKQNT
jgi:hypothetical protein